MKATIDAFDGRGPMDYSQAIDAKDPIRIVRRLNEPSLCTFGIVAMNTSLPLLRNSQVRISDSDGNCYFSGYLATEPMNEYLGSDSEGGYFIAHVSAASDEVLLDRQMLGGMSSTAGQTASSLMAGLTGEIGAGLVNVDRLDCPRVLGHFSAVATETWSKNAGEVASRARASYRIVDGNLTMAPIGSAVHELSEGDGSLQVGALKATMAKELVNDVLLCGEEEPSAYVTELFEGDGTTALFDLTDTPFTTAASDKTWLNERFDEPAIDSRTWRVADPGAHLSLTSAGLTFSGGTGIAGQTTLTAASVLEAGGSLLLEAGGVVLDAGSDGLLLGLCQGTANEANCFAGFRVKQAGGVTSVVAVAGGTESGPSALVNAGSVYTLRLRIYCSEQQRVLESFYSEGDSGLMAFGGDLIAASARVVMEIQELINGMPASAVVFYDGVIGEAPATASLVVASSTQLTGSIRSVLVERPTPVWVRSAPLSGGWTTRRIGSSVSSGECRLEAPGSVRFFPGSIPAAGECISVSYRTKRRAVARNSRQESVEREGVAGFPGTCAFAGTLTRPKARSSADCENASLALLNVSCSRWAAVTGRYDVVGAEGDPLPGGDVWPGDLLALNAPENGLQGNVVVRDVKLEIASGGPRLMSYAIGFANDWASELSLAVSSTVAADVWIPSTPNAAVLDSLSGLTVSVSGGAIAVDAGVAPPAGGGFEVRRRDWAFAAGDDSDLVLRSPVQHFSIPRWNATEQYYVRMYDASTPPVYSRVSSAVFLNIPM